MASTHPTATGGPSQHAAGNSNAFLRESSSTNIAPTPRSSSLPLSLSLPRMGLSQSKPQPSTPTSSSAKGSISAAVAGGIKLKRAFAARRKKTGEGSSRDVSPSPAAMTPVHSQAPPSQLQQQQHQQRPTFTTSPLSAPSNTQSNQAQAPQQQAVSSIQRFNLQNHPPSPTLTLSLQPLSKQQSQQQQQLGTSGRHPQSPTRGSHSIPNVPGAFSSPPSSSGLVQSPLHSELPLTTGGSSPSPTMSQQQSQNAMLTPPSTSTSMTTRAINRSSVIPLSPGITSAVTYISMLDRQQEALENKEKEKEEAEKERELERQKAQEKENAEKEQQQRKQLPVPPSQPSLQRQDSQPTRRQLPTPPTTSLISNPVAATPATSTVVVTASAAASQQAASPSQSSASSPTPTSTPLPTPSLSSTTAPASDVTSLQPASSLASTATDLTSTSMAALPLKAESKDKESWRKSDSTNSYHTIRPPRPTLNASVASNRASFTSSPASASPTATSRPVSWAESFQSAQTVVQGAGGQAQGQGGRPLSALFVGGGVGMVEESEEEGLSDDDDEPEDDDEDRRRVNFSEIGDGEDSETEESEGESDIGIDNVDTASSVTSASNASSSKTPSLSSGSGAGSNSGKKIVLKRRSMSLGDASQYVTPVSPISAAAHNMAAASSDFSSHSKMKQPSLSISEGVPVPPSSQQPKLSTKNLKGKLAAWTSASGSGASASSSSKHQQHHHPQERDLPAIPPNTSPASPPIGATFSSVPGAQSLPVWAQHVSQASLGSINSFNSTTSSSHDHQPQANNASSNTRPAQHQQAVFPQQRQASQQSFTQSQPLRQQLHMATSPPNQNLSVPHQHQHQHQPSRSPAISLTSGGFGLAKRAVEKMGKWGFGSGGSSSSSSAASTSNSVPSSYKDKDYGTGSIGSYSTHSASSASISGGGATGSGSSNSGHPPPPNSFVQGMSLFGYAIQRVASGSHAHSGGGGSGSGNSSAAEEKLGRKERKEREKREREREKAGNAHMKSPSSVSSAGAESSLGMPVPASPSKRSHHLFGHGNGHGHGHGHVAGASVSSAFSLDSSSRNAGDHDLQPQQQEGPSLGRPIRAPMIPVSKVKGGGTGGSGLVFKRHLKDCVKETGVWVTSSGRSARREKRNGIRGVDVDEETLALIKELEEERSVPALVVRCAQHLLLWGVQEEGLFRVSGMPSHVSKLRAEFDAGADYDMTECNPGELDPHAVAVVFKAYLRELPEPLLTKKLQHEFDAAIKQENTLNSASDSARTASAGTSTKTGLPSGPKAGLRKPPSLSTLAMPSFHGIPPASAPLLATLRVLIRQLPKENRDLALTVVDLIRATAKASKRTKMPLSNLLLVFCPSLGMTPPLLKVLCEGEGIWDEKGDSELEVPVDVDEVIDIRRMTIKPADVGKDVPPPRPVIDISKPGDEVEDDGKSRVSVDTADTDNYHASEESADEDEHDAASSSPSLAMSSKASVPAQRRNASVDLRQAEQEMEAEKERRRHARDSEAPTIYMDTRSHLSSSSSSFAPEMTPGAESTKSFAQQQQSSPRPSVVLNNQTGSQRPKAGKQMRRRSIALLSLPGFSPSTTASSSAASSPGSSGRSSFPSLGNEENSQVTTQKTLRTKKPSLKLLFSKMSAAAQGAPNSATVGGKTISGPILHQEDSEDEDEYGQSSISTPISAVTAPQSSIPGPNSSPRLNHKGSRTMLTVAPDSGARSRASSTASSHFPPVLDTPIEDPSLEALDGMLGGFDVSSLDTALLTSSNPTPTTASLSSSVTSPPTSPPVSSTRRPVIGRGRKPQQQQQQDLKTPVVHPHPLAIQPGNNSNVSLESGSSSSSASALSSASSVSLASSHHLSLFEGDEEGQETMEDWTQSVLLAAADVSLGGMDRWEGVGVGVKGGKKGDEERKAQN
ncbi:hypothetical protein D9613_000228 [Agrocybe pediades]|uniref:Rho-GAP domain-containing protein n=1 Tax=Agrocybe pediades TaxID=84607 RepID=A0A8H4R141_9AGAR|nr:hypothetical protein D9613_000228 [Agrocybe pediades]